MKKINLIILMLFFVFGANSCFASNVPWTNNLRTMFINNAAFIYTLNIRSFGAKDYNNNDIIEIELGEAPGTFINAIPKLQNLSQSGINTIYLLPVTKTGKLKALGTAGSLYAIDSFDKLNPQLLDKTDFSQDIEVQAKKFVNEAHRLQMHVIVDLPSCGSYDMSLEKPELFLKDKNNKAVIPADWTDVRVFKVYEADNKLNRALVDEYKSFVDMAQRIGFDGIRADVAAIKPYEFWKEIIDYARENDENFLFLAEASPKWTNPIKGLSPYATVEELLSAGFDGYYADWSNLKDIKNASEFNSKVQDDLRILNKFEGKKSVIANLATHDQTSPAALGYQYWQMVNWLNVTLPINPYVLDGFPAGDTYSYKYQNKKAEKSYTDDDTYFVHRGKLDIFNFSRAPKEIDPEAVNNEFMNAVQLRYMLFDMLSSKNVEFLSTNNSNVFAFRKTNGSDSVVIVGNLNYKETESVKVKVPKLSDNDFVMPFKMIDPPTTKKGQFEIHLRPYEIQVLAIKKTNLSK